MAEKEETAELTVRIPKREAAKLQSVAETVFGITGPMLARILIHQALGNFAETFARLGVQGTEAMRKYDLEHPR